jgi:hypothetical protein
MISGNETGVESIGERMTSTIEPRTHHFVRLLSVSFTASVAGESLSGPHVLIRTTLGAFDLDVVNHATGFILPCWGRICP